MTLHAIVSPRLPLLLACALAIAPAAWAATPFKMRVPIGPNLSGGAPAPVASSLTLSRSSVDFGTVAVLDTASEIVTVSNTGDTAQPVAVTEPAAPFGVTHDCPASLPAGASCTLTYTLSPIADGSVSGASAVSGLPVALSGFGDTILVKQAAAGVEHTVFLRYDGTVWATGLGLNGLLGNGNNAASATPVQAIQMDGAPLANVRSIAASGRASIAVKNDGTLWVTHPTAFRYEQKMNGANPVTNVAAVVTGDMYISVLKDDGSVWTTGDNTYGQWGDGSNQGGAHFGRMTKADGQFIDNVAALAAGQHHLVVLQHGGKVWATGYNYFGQVGNGTAYNNQYRLGAVLDIDGLPIENAVGIGAGGDTTYVIRAGGGAWGGGRNDNGQLGLGHTTNYQSRLKPMTDSTLSVLENVVSVTGGAYHSVAVKSDGTVWASGYNGYSQLGNGNTTQQTRFVQAQNADGSPVSGAAAAVAVVGHSSWIRKADGSFHAVGDNARGQFGDGTQAGRTRFLPTPAAP